GGTQPANLVDRGDGHPSLKIPRRNGGCSLRQGDNRSGKPPGHQRQGCQAAEKNGRPPPQEDKAQGLDRALAFCGMSPGAHPPAAVLYRLVGCHHLAPSVVSSLRKAPVASECFSYSRRTGQGHLGDLRGVAWWQQVTDFIAQTRPDNNFTRLSQACGVR